MYRLIAALLAATSCAVGAQAQMSPPVNIGPPVLTLDQAVIAAGGRAPIADAAAAGIEGARAARIVAGLRPNPTVQTQFENFAGSGDYRRDNRLESTVSLAVSLEMGGKRSARIAVADAQADRALLIAAIAQADIRLQVTQLYTRAIAAERRLVIARDQARIANDAFDAARVRVQAGRASPLEEQRAGVARINAQANVERMSRLADAARTNLSLHIGRQVTESLDDPWFERLPQAYGPAVPTRAAGTLALAAADADLAIADAGVRLARSQRIPDLDVGPGVRRFSDTGDTALVFTLSLPIPLFNSGSAAVAQASAERSRVEARRRAAALDVEQAITTAQADVANAALTARTSSGPALAAAEEAARIARIGYREGKFGQLDLLDAERTLGETRIAAVDALATYQDARAQLERLTAPAPQQGN